MFHAKALRLKPKDAKESKAARHVMKFVPDYLSRKHFQNEKHLITVLKKYERNKVMPTASLWDKVNLFATLRSFASPAMAGQVYVK